MNRFAWDKWAHTTDILTSSLSDRSKLCLLYRASGVLFGAAMFTESPDRMREFFRMEKRIGKVIHRFAEKKGL